MNNKTFICGAAALVACGGGVSLAGWICLVGLSVGFEVLGLQDWCSLIWSPNLNLS